MTWSAADVRAAARAWVWVPVDATEIETAEYRLTFYPERTSVQWSRSERAASAVVDEVLGHVQDRGRTAVRWWVSEDTRPSDTVAALERRGFTPAETVDVLAYELGGPDGPRMPGLDVPADVVVEPVRDEATLRTASEIDAEVFDWPPMTDAQVAQELELIRPGRRTGRPTLLRLLARLEGQVVGTAGIGLAGEVGRLWGAGVVPGARGRGVYRALLDARLRWAVENRATIGLVKGRALTSAPTLRRAGFVSYGEETCWEGRAS